MTKKISKTLIVFCIVTFILTSCSGIRYFYATNTNVKAIEIKNATVLQTFLPNRKNVKISFTQILPDKTDKNTIILVVPPNGGNSSILAEIIEVLVADGYSVYLFDYQGYGKSEGKPTNANVLTDAQMILNYVVENNSSNAKIIIWGFSLGGNLAVKLAADNCQKISALVTEGAFSSHRDIAREFLPKWLKWTAFIVKSPYPSKENIKNVTVPVLITHSVNDEVVPFEMGKTLYENAKSPKCFLTLSGEHCFGLQTETKIYIEKLNEILTQNR
jgi:alpha-beta hydrolase superfamily lysophospholipase